MPYTVDQLIEDFRSDVYDRADVDGQGVPRDTLWSPEDVLRYANNAVAQWAKDTLAVRRNITLVVAPGQSRYYVGADVLEIVRAGLVTGADPAARPRALTRFDLGEGCISDDYGLIYYSTYDLENRRGLTRGVTFDYDPSYLRLYPIPAEGGWLHLNLTIYPTDLQCGMPLPSSNHRDIHLILLWMKHMAYAKQDADTQDLDRSNDFYRQYRTEVIDRMHELDHQRRDAGVMRPRW